MCKNKWAIRLPSRRRAGLGSTLTFSVVAQEQQGTADIARLLFKHFDCPIMEKDHATMTLPFVRGRHKRAVRRSPRCILQVAPCYLFWLTLPGRRRRHDLCSRGSRSSTQSCFESAYASKSAHLAMPPIWLYSSHSNEDQLFKKKSGTLKSGAWHD